MCDVGQLQRVESARNTVLFRGFVGRIYFQKKRKTNSSEQRGGADDRPPKMSPKFAPRCSERAALKKKNAPRCTFGIFYPVAIHKVCTTL